jgi:hypothetical protein
LSTIKQQRKLNETEEKARKALYFKKILYNRDMG